MYFWGILAPSRQIVGSLLRDPGQQIRPEKWYFFILANAFLGYSGSILLNSRIFNENLWPEKQARKMIFFNTRKCTFSWLHHVSFIFLASPRTIVGFLLRTPGQQSRPEIWYFLILANAFLGYSGSILLNGRILIENLSPAKQARKMIFFNTCKCIFGVLWIHLAE